MSKPELKRGYSVRLGSGQPEFDSLQFRLRHIFFFVKLKTSTWYSRMQYDRSTM